MASKILIVDDDPNNMELIYDFLEDKTHELLWAPNGFRAVELALLEQPDLIIMDWQMPVMDGIEAIHVLKENETTKNIAIIMTTGVMMSPENTKTALDTGAVDFLKKPFNPIEFNARVRANMRIKQQHELITQLLKNEKRLMQEALERKERELSSAAMFEHEKNTMLIKILKELDKLDDIDNPEVKENIIHIRRQLKTQLNLERSWANFKIHFEEVHPSFFLRLEEQFEGLSTNERKICAYLKIGLENKEIAILTNVVSASVRKALNRLKSKMGLSEDENLRAFISRI